MLHYYILIPTLYIYQAHKVNDNTYKAARHTKLMIILTKQPGKNINNLPFNHVGCLVCPNFQLCKCSSYLLSTWSHTATVNCPFTRWTTKHESIIVSN